MNKGWTIEGQTLEYIFKTDWGMELVDITENAVDITLKLKLDPFLPNHFIYIKIGDFGDIITKQRLLELVAQKIFLEIKMFKEYYAGLQQLVEKQILPNLEKFSKIIDEE